MKNLEIYIKGTAPLEKREEIIFSLIDSLDNESYKLFNEIVDLSDYSYYKLSNLSIRAKELKRIYTLTNELFEYIKDIETASFDYAKKRWQLKCFLTSYVTLQVFLTSKLISTGTITQQTMLNYIATAIFGVGAFTVLFKKANKDYAYELSAISESVRRFSDERLAVIGSTLDNCERLIYAKYKNHEKDENIDILITEANNFIASFIDGKVTEEETNTIPNELKRVMVTILKQDLTSESDDLLSLLNEAKNNYYQRLKLIKEY